MRGKGLFDTYLKVYMYVFDVNDSYGVKDNHAIWRQIYNATIWDIFLPNILIQKSENNFDVTYKYII